ncbi:IclR family transcriptional regulator [Haloprofundus salilacus]|uniref:IclR family transcriptional regulator n=1 Tax=Haloprofundus salilacus TaxID=2876190 RepID=UPI001CCC6245|nr:IclR family transcriptional regulator [Haloprofundus salilacus]
MANGPTEPVKAVETTLEILEALEAADSAGVSELATELGRSKSTVHRHLSTLENRGYVARNGSAYHVGLRSLRLAASALDQQLVYPVTKSVVNELAEETGESAAVAVEEQSRAVYLYYNRTDQAVRTDASLGIRLYLHCTGAGKAILAHLPEGRVEEILDERGLPEKTQNTITDRETLFDELAEIRRTGVAFDDEERLDGMRGVATPILNRETNDLLGALTVAGPTRRVNGRWFREDIPDLLQRASKMVEVSVTYQ